MVSISYTTVALILTAVAVLFYLAFRLYGTWSAKSLKPGDLGQMPAHDEEEKEDHGSYRR